MENIILSAVPLDALKKELLEAIKLEISSALAATAANKPELEYLTRHQTAQLFSVSLGTIDEWTKSGKLIGYRIGRRVRFKRNEVLNCLSTIRIK